MPAGRLPTVVHSEANISDYYKAFGICNDPKSRGDITPFVEMFLGIVETAVTQLGEALQKRSEKLAYYRSRSDLLPDAADAKMAQLYDYLIQAALFSENGIGTEELLRLFGVSRNTLQKSSARSRRWSFCKRSRKTA